MLRSILFVSIFSTGAIAASAGEFVGKLQLAPKGCEITRDCRLVYDFGYIDSNGVGWQSSAKDQTDGATIPSWAQGFIGTPFEKDFIKAAVIHDHYCDRNVRSWRQTHWVLYDALIAGGVSDLKAKVMYYAVLIGGPKWVELIPGVPCKVGHVCIKNVSGLPNIPDAQVRDNDSGNKILFRKDRYDDPAFMPEFESGKAAIEASSGSMTLDQIFHMARSRLPSDFYLSNGDAIRYEDTGSMFPDK